MPKSIQNKVRPKSTKRSKKKQPKPRKGEKRSKAPRRGRKSRKIKKGKQGKKYRKMKGGADFTQSNIDKLEIEGLTTDQAIEKGRMLCDFLFDSEHRDRHIYFVFYYDYDMQRFKIRIGVNGLETGKKKSIFLLDYFLTPKFDDYFKTKKHTDSELYTQIFNLVHKLKSTYQDYGKRLNIEIEAKSEELNSEIKAKSEELNNQIKAQSEELNNQIKAQRKRDLSIEIKENIRGNEELYVADCLVQKGYTSTRKPEDIILNKKKKHNFRPSLDHYFIILKYDITSHQNADGRLVSTIIPGPGTYKRRIVFSNYSRDTGTDDLPGNYVKFVESALETAISQEIIN